jgi:regulator of sigma E protease
MSDPVAADVAGPVGIAALTGQMARMGFAYVVQFTALLSINLAIINALPIPALDGGKLLFLAIEKVKGRPVKAELENTIHYIGFALLMTLVLVITFRDIAKYSETVGGLVERIF